jgi:hypothetical protein
MGAAVSALALKSSLIFFLLEKFRKNNYARRKISQRIKI